MANGAICAELLVGDVLEQRDRLQPACVQRVLLVSANSVAATLPTDGNRRAAAQGDQDRRAKARRRRQAKMMSTASATTARPRATGTMKAASVSASAPMSSISDRTGFAMPAVPTVEIGPNRGPAGVDGRRHAAAEEDGRERGQVGVGAGLTGEEGRARCRGDDRADRVEDGVDGWDLVADEVGDRKGGEHHQRARSAEGVERLRQVHEVEPLSQGAGEERQPRIEARGRGQPEGGGQAGHVHDAEPTCRRNQGFAATLDRSRFLKERFVRRLISAAALVAALAAVSPAAAITDGTADGQGHPNVGGLVAATQYSDGTWIYCSGTLISPTVFLTAAHCAEPSPQVRVTFDSAYQAGDKVYTGTFHGDPLYNKRRATRTTSRSSCSTRRSGITPAQLRPPTRCRTSGEPAVHVGGLRRAMRSTNGPGGHQYLYNDVRGVATGTLNTVNPGWLKISMNPSHGDGGTCYGDSGGPNFLGGPTETNIVAATTITGDAVCRSTNVD